MQGEGGAGDGQPYTGGQPMSVSRVLRRELLGPSRERMIHVCAGRGQAPTSQALCSLHQGGA